MMKNSIMNRRRFLTISAGLGLGTLAASHYMKVKPKYEWRGHLLGAEASITLYDDNANAKPAIEAALAEINALEKRFSIYDPSSQLSLLNSRGDHLVDDQFIALMREIDLIHDKTNGLFDPTVQPVFIGQENATMGWQYVKRVGNQISFDRPQMAMTLNGIAQGFITDRVHAILTAHGQKDIVVNMGEYHVGEKAHDMKVANNKGAIIHRLELQSNAIATSSPENFKLANGMSHIIHPGLKHRSQWRTISVVAENATLADGYSTALSLSEDRRLAENLIKQGILQKVILEDFHGKTHTI